MTSNVLLFPGPLHPDLFDGETPVMLPADAIPKLFEVEVSYLTPATEVRKVTALNAKEAEVTALDAVKNDLEEEGCQFRVEAVDELDEDPDMEQLFDWADKRGESHADV